MIYFLIAVLVLVVVIFGASSVMQSYASAQQAQAAIEASKTAQALAFNQTINTLVIALVLVLLVAVIVALTVYILRRQQATPKALQPKRSTAVRLSDIVEERVKPVEWSFDPIDDAEYTELMQFMDDERRK